jgi:hypothetical protein
MDLILEPYRSPVSLRLNGQPVPKVVRNNRLTVTIPASAQLGTGYFELLWDGRRFSSPPITIVP